MRPTLITQKSTNLVDKFGEGDCCKNKARKTFASTKGPTREDYLSFNHPSHAVSNIVSNSAKNISNYLTPDAKKVFDQLRQVFTQALIFQHFDPERYIWIKTNVSGYAINGVLNQLTNDSSQWHPVAYFLHKMIPAKTWYTTHNGKFLTIVEAFKTWRHYPKGCKHKILDFTDYNNFCHLIDMKSPSSCQVRWAQELSKYNFRIDYCQGKVNGATDALFCFPQQDNKEKANLWAKNTWILHYLQSLLTNASISGLNTTFLGLSPQH